MSASQDQDGAAAWARLERYCRVHGRTARAFPSARSHCTHLLATGRTGVGRQEEFKIEIVGMVHVQRQPLLDGDDALNKDIGGYHRDYEEKKGHKSQAPARKLSFDCLW